MRGTARLGKEETRANGYFAKAAGFGMMGAN